jgi:hypothetical protein
VENSVKIRRAETRKSVGRVQEEGEKGRGEERGEGEGERNGRGKEEEETGK